MSNAKTLAISPASFVGVLTSLGARTTEQSGFIRVDGPEGRRMYVGRGKITTTVHLSGWNSAEQGLTQPLEKSPSSKVTHEMAWPDGLNAVDQLRLFARLYAEMMSLSPAAKKAASSPEKRAPVQPQVIDPALVLSAPEPTMPEARAEEPVEQLS